MKKSEKVWWIAWLFGNIVAVLTMPLDKGQSIILYSLLYNGILCVVLLGGFKEKVKVK